MEQQNKWADLSEACTHNCATCQSACGADGSGAGKFEKALDAVSEIEGTVASVYKGQKSVISRPYCPFVHRRFPYRRNMRTSVSFHFV